MRDATAGLELGFPTPRLNGSLIHSLSQYLLSTCSVAKLCPRDTG